MKKIKIAITGGIGSGKSTVARYFAALGYPVFSCDEIYRKIYNSSSFQKLLCQEFPMCASGGKIDKKSLSTYVFSNQSALNKLNELTHEKIIFQLDKLISESDSKVVFAEVPLLFEGGYQEMFDQVIVVLRDQRTRVQAVCSRDRLSEENVLLRMARQWDYDDKNNLEYLKSKNYVLIHNDQNIAYLEAQLKNVLENLFE